MNVGESFPECGRLHLAINPQGDRGGLHRAAQKIRWLPGVLDVADNNGELEVVFHAPATGLLRQIHHALATCRSFPEL
jgi:hypothetical protein